MSEQDGELEWREEDDASDELDSVIVPVNDEDDSPAEEAEKEQERQEQSGQESPA